MCPVLQLCLHPGLPQGPAELVQAGQRAVSLHCCMQPALLLNAGSPLAHRIPVAGRISARLRRALQAELICVEQMHCHQAELELEGLHGIPACQCWTESDGSLSQKLGMQVRIRFVRVS